MSDKIELLPCPFCGLEARLESNRDWHRIIVDHDEACIFLDSEVSMVPATDDQLGLAVADWNRRAAIAQQPAPVNKSVIRDVFLRNGFTIKEGQTDLKPYVYAAAEELLSLDGKSVATAPAAPVAQEPVACEYPHDTMDAMAVARYTVGESDAGLLSRFAVRAGDGQQEIYRGSKSDCDAVARKLAGAFLDGGLCLHAIVHTAPPAAEQPDSVAGLEVLIDKWRTHAKMLRKDKQPNVADMADDCADELRALLEGGYA